MGKLPSRNQPSMNGTGSAIPQKSMVHDIELLLKSLTIEELQLKCDVAAVLFWRLGNHLYRL